MTTFGSISHEHPKLSEPKQAADSQEAGSGPKQVVADIRQACCRFTCSTPLPEFPKPCPKSEGRNPTFSRGRFCLDCDCGHDVGGAISEGKGHFAGFLSTGRERLEEITVNLKNLIEDGKSAEAFLFMQNKWKSKGVRYPYLTKLVFFIAASSKRKIDPFPLIFDKWPKNAYYELLTQSCSSEVTKYFSGTIYPLCSGASTAKALFW